MSTSIEWTAGDDGSQGKTWNPIRGCSLASPGCTNCYAMRQAHRFSGKGKPFHGLTVLRNHGPTWTGTVRFVPEMIGLPLRWKKPCRVFVNSMADLFHESVTNDEIAAVFGVMAACPQHTFQCLTKRAKRMREWFAWVEVAAQEDIECATRSANPRAYGINQFLNRTARMQFQYPARSIGSPAFEAWPLPWVWLGVSVENQQYADERIGELLSTPAAVRFISYEPALGPIDLFAFLKGDIRDRSLAELGSPPMPGLAWLICGGESGPGARPFDLAWAQSVINQCKAAGVACFVKQLGAHPYNAVSEVTQGMGGIGLGLRDPKGGDMSEWPPALRVRQWPEVRT